MTTGKEDTPLDEDNVSTSELERVLTNERGIPVYEPIEIGPAPVQGEAFDVNGPRLMITHIINENFKSYAGTQTLGPFHKSFSAIVGPNGSGKSNVIDSMLFVFGYRASKIRSKKLSVLLHNSEKHKDINSCTVSVYFQKIIDTGPGDNDYDVVPNSKFVVSRTAFKDNTSYYRLNEKKVTYKEVATVLRTNGIDLDHNRFLILQGEVEQIAMMKPKAPSEHEDGMLEFLEDIIGCSRFKEPIEKVEKRVEELNEMRNEKLNRVKVVEKEKNDLESVRNEAVEYLTLVNSITKNKNIVYQKYIHDCSVFEKQAAEKRDKILEKKKVFDDQLSEIMTEKKAKNKEHSKIWKKYELLTKECEEKQEEFSKFEQEDIRCREGLKHAKAKHVKLDKSLEQEEKKLSELKMIPEKTEKDIADLEKKLKKLDAEKAVEEDKLKEVMESLKTETQDLQVEKDAKETELLELQKVVNETKSKYSVAQSELDIYISNQKEETTKLEAIHRNLENTQATLRDRKKAVTDLQKKLPDLQKTIAKAQKDLEDANAKELQIVNNVREMRVKVEEARSSLQQSQSRGSVLEALMQLKKNGSLPGIYGRLGDLGAIDAKYDVAISTACGALDHIVVDSINTAQACVEILKKNNIGCATFIGLEKMEKWKGHCKRTIKTPENVPRLFDLVQVSDETVRPAFYFALRDTLVANDLDQATRIAYGRTRYRVVTLGGQLIDQSGTMSGGGSRVCKGRMGSKVISDIDPQDMQRMEQQLQQRAEEAKHCQQTKLKLEETIDKLKKSLDEVTFALEKFTMEIKSLTEQEASLKHQEKEQEKKVKDAAPDEKQLKKMEKSVAAFKKEYEKAQAEASKVEEEVHRLHKQIMDIGGTKLKAAESRINVVQTQIDQIAGNITRANVAVKTAKRNAAKTETRVQSLKEDIEENSANIEKLEAEFKKIEEEAINVVQAYEKSQAAMKEVEDTVAEIKKAIADLEKKEQELQKDEIEIKHEVEHYDNIVRENMQKIRHWKKELGRLSLHQIDEEEKEQLETLEAGQLEDVDKEDIEYQITILEEKMSEMKPNMAAIAEYRKKEDQYLKRVRELDEITELRNEQRKYNEELRKQRLNEFMSAFIIITTKLKEMYQMITLGGDAELELVDSLDPFSEGIVFSVRPPKKSWKNISNLSGGEKTLSSLALVFALHHYKPTPLYVMDEIDAALDFKNVSIVANYIKERTKNAQFIIISLRNNMFELADRLIGIYKTYDCTKSVTINPKKICMPVMTVDASISEAVK